jgi:hypothetical protein
MADRSRSVKGLRTYGASQHRSWSEEVRIMMHYPVLEMEASRRRTEDVVGPQMHYTESLRRRHWKPTRESRTPKLLGSRLS